MLLSLKFPNVNPKIKAKKTKPQVTNVNNLAANI
jgi:hypothetical protein